MTRYLWCERNESSASAHGHTDECYTESPVQPVLESAYRIALRQIEADADVINRLKQALRVATHSPHDQAGEPNEGFPVCSVWGAIQTSPVQPVLSGLDAPPVTTLISWLDTAISLADEHGSEAVSVTAHMLRLVRARLAATAPAADEGPDR